MNRLLQETVAQQADRRPEATAVVMGRERLSYGELDSLSNQLGRLLRESGCAKGDRVCFLMPKSPRAIVSMLGILKAGCLYVPLDPASPPARLAKVVQSCENRWILADGGVVGTLNHLVSSPELCDRLAVGWMSVQPIKGAEFEPGFGLADLARYDARGFLSETSVRDPAHLLFTSGSTGVPKGVVITHANVLHFVDWAHRYFGTSSDDRISGHPPLHFDLSTFDVFGTLAAGAELHLVPTELNLFARKLAEFIRANELTQWFSVPSVLVYMARFDAVKPNDFPALRRLLWCGEVFPTPSLRHWMQRLPHVSFTNLYGPTEATIASSYYRVAERPTDDRQSIPIGTACDGEELLVLNEGLEPVAVGETGDLYIGGPGLSPGYWRDPDRTDAAFIRRPHSTERIYKTGDLARIGDDGLVYYMGRLDSQIKSRGYRIELGEIETAVHAVPGVRECAVVAVPSRDFDGLAICCAYICNDAEAVSPASLATAVGRSLPSYMLPSRWLALERFPQNANGKVDRRALRELFQPDPIPGQAPS
jgi:amino acid adenylation domain-containing protein